MPKFSEQMRCSCGSSIFAKSEIVVTDPGKVVDTGEVYLKCMICLRDLVYDQVNACLKGVTREDGKKLIVQFERVTRESDRPEAKQLEELAQAIKAKGTDLERIAIEDLDEGALDD